MLIARRLRRLIRTPAIDQSQLFLLQMIGEDTGPVSDSDEAREAMSRDRLAASSRQRPGREATSEQQGNGDQ